MQRHPALKDRGGPTLFTNEGKDDAQGATMTAILDRVRSDDNLARRAIGGDVPAFDELYRRYRPGLAAYGARLLGDREGGEDVAQIALFNAYRALGRGTQPKNLQAWLYRIARNAAFEVARRRREHPVAHDPAEPAADTQESSAVRGALLDGLRDLPDRQRRTFVLRELHGYSSAETAAELQLTVPQVEQALFAARNRLAERLVFGGRLDCDDLRQLDPSSLDLAERRALRAHSRSCPSCRTSLSRSALGALVIPLGLVASAREALAATLGSAVASAPAAVKVGAAVVTAAVATGVPASVEVATERDGPRQAVVEVVSEPRPAVDAAPAVVEEEPVEEEPVGDVAPPVDEPVEVAQDEPVAETEVVPPPESPGPVDGLGPGDVGEDEPFAPAPPDTGSGTVPAEPEPADPPATGEGTSEETGAEVLGVVTDAGTETAAAPDETTAGDGLDGPTTGESSGTEPACEGDPCTGTDPATAEP